MPEHNTAYGNIGQRTFVLLQNREIVEVSSDNKSKPSKSFSRYHSSTSIYMKKAWS
ncbi:hypothetical protein SAMN05720469_10930 [Fibrobacter intestinalis]|uniref:Uncharacterized protein n=1 Tax=Fibrobacter intestinalis TaxID=28122 RepID=A0A1M6T945_9BACT|nr:hypothetical protein SAMN05720469_10930 [Fibrobacter intestinalis]